MEQVVSKTLTEFNSSLDEPINVTKLLEERHIAFAVHSILIALSDYCSGFSNSFESSATTYRSPHHLWISIGEVPLSRILKDAITQKFLVTNGNLLFYNWEEMSSKYPNVSKFGHLRERSPAFVGFPLPDEDTSE